MPSLFELPDPFATLRYRMRPPSPFAAARAGRAGGSAVEDDYQLQPQEREGLLRSLGRQTVGGIGAAANLIDLPGSMVRDTLGLLGTGDFSKYNPLDQILSPFSPENRSYGRGLLEEAGILGRNTPGFDAGDVAGFGVDLFTDPLSWLSGGIAGAGTKFGKLASKAGVIDDITRLGRSGKIAGLGKDAGKRFIQRTMTGADVMANPEIAGKIEKVAERTLGAGWKSDLAGMADQPIRTAFGINVPFTNIGLGNLGAGAPATSWFAQGVNKVLDSLGMKTAQRTPLDVIGETLRWSTPGIHAASLFSAANKGRKTKDVQQLAQRLTQGQRSAEHVLRGEVLELAQRLEEAGKMDEATSWTLRSIGEGVAPVSSDVSGVASKLRDLFDEDMQKAWAAGLDRNPISDVIDYVARYADPEYAKSLGGSSKPFRAKTSEDVARAWIFKGDRLGTKHLNEAVIKDSVIDGFIQQRMPGVTNGQQLNQLRRDVADLIEKRHGSVIEEWHQVTKRGGKTRDVNRYRGLAKWLISHPQQRTEGLYTGHVLADANRRLAMSANEVESSKAVLDFIGENALPAGGIPDGVRVYEVLDKLGGFNTKTTERVWRGNKVAVPTAYDVLAQKFGGAGGDWANRMIPKDVAEDLVGLMPKLGKDESAKYFAQWWDSYNSLWKAAVLTRPARYFRDLFSGQAQLVQEGAWDGASYLNFHRLLTGRTVPAAVNLPQIKERLAAKLATAPAGMQSKFTLTPENATRELRIMYAQYGPGIHNIATETVGKTQGGFERSLKELLATMPRSTKQNEGQFAAELLKTATGNAPDTVFKPWKAKVRGVMGAEETTWGPIKAGEDLGRYTDDMNRGVGFLNLLKKGYDPEAAMRRINQIEVNYDPRTFTPAEKTLRRLFPFYTFTSRMMGYTAKTLGQRPGGPMGQTIKALNAMRSDDPLLPEYVANTAAIPLGQTPEGSKRYLTGASLMFEDPMQFLGGGLGGGTLEAMSRMAPIPKYLAELATGQSFFQRGAYGGRSLDDLNPPMGQTLANIQEMATGVKPARTKPVIGDWFEQIAGTLIPGASTVTTAARKASEPERGVLEKAMNLGTGFQTSLIRPAAQDAILDELIRKEQRKLGGRSFTKTFIPEEVKATFDPVERLTASRIAALADELAARKKERKKQRMATGK